MGIEEALSTFIVALATEQAMVGLVSFILAISGFQFLLNLSKNPSSHLNQYIIQVLGLCFILPILLVVSVLKDIEAETIVGLLGTLIGYVFGSSANRQSQNTPPGAKPENVSR